MQVIDDGESGQRMSTSTRSIAGTLKTIWLIGNGNRGTRSGPDDDRALFVGGTPPQVGTEKAYDVREFVDDLRDLTPHIAQNTSNRTSAPTNLATMNSLARLQRQFTTRRRHEFQWPARSLIHLNLSSFFDSNL